MRTKSKKISFLSLSFIFALALLGTFLMPLQKNTALAQNGTLEIAGPDIIDTSLYPTSVEYTATLTGSEFASEKIDWYYNDTLILKTNDNIKQGTTTNSSTLQLSASYYFAEVSGGFARISARVYNNDTLVYDTSREVMILKPSTSIAISLNTNSQNFNSNGVYTDFIYTITTPTITSTNDVKWYLLDSFGKYNPLSVQAGIGFYLLKPTKPGTYTVVAKVDNVFSKPISARVFYDSVSSLNLTYEKLDKNELGLDVYKFTLQNLTEHHDISNINWYRKGYNNAPLQYGGDTFIFEPTSYASYQIYARYEPNQVESNSYVIEIKIDRTKDIIIFASIIIGFMTVGLIVLIYRNIKKDKVW